MKTGCIYAIVNTLNGKRYIGQTTNLEKRIYDHFRGDWTSRELQLDVQEHGKDVFKVEVLAADIPENELYKMESYFIRLHNTKFPHGYNLTDGGGGMKGFSHTPETRAKLHEANIGNQHAKGAVRSPETRAKIRKGNLGNQNAKGAVRSPEARAKVSKARKGKPLTPEHRAKLSEAKKENKNGSGNKGKRCSPETRRKLSEALKGQIPWNKGLTGLPHSHETRRKISDSHKRRHAAKSQ